MPSSNVAVHHSCVDRGTEAHDKLLFLSAECLKSNDNSPEPCDACKSVRLGDRIIPRDEIIWDHTTWTTSQWTRFCARLNGWCREDIRTNRRGFPRRLSPRRPWYLPLLPRLEEKAINFGCNVHLSPSQKRASSWNFENFNPSCSCVTSIIHFAFCFLCLRRPG